uniref:Uncharacterized protein n=1 Tax=Mandrillus leucophaeus TaxID=9568 RepID=A0A2K5ZDN6_MANLE
MKEPVAPQPSRATIFKMKIVMITLLIAKSQEGAGWGGGRRTERSRPGCHSGVLKTVTPPGTSDEGLKLDTRGGLSRKNKKGPPRVSLKLPAVGKPCPITRLATPPAHLHSVEVTHHSRPSRPSGQENGAKK